MFGCIQVGEKNLIAKRLRKRKKIGKNCEKERKKIFEQGKNMENNCANKLCEIMLQLEKKKM